MNKKKLKSSAKFLNVDLEIRSRPDIKPLVEALSRTLDPNHVGRWGRAHFATFAILFPKNADSAIRRMIRTVTRLPQSAKRLWNHSQDRVFDIGIEQRPGLGIFALPLKQETLEGIAKIGARVAITIYPRTEDVLKNQRRRSRTSASAVARRKAKSARR